MSKEKQYYSKLGAQLSSLRNAKGLSVDEVAKKLNLESAELNSIESGETEVSVGVFLALTDLYNADINELVKTNRTLKAADSEVQYTTKTLQETIVMMSLNFEHQKAMLLKEIELLRSKLNP